MLVDHWMVQDHRGCEVDGGGCVESEVRNQILT